MVSTLNAAASAAAALLFWTIVGLPCLRFLGDGQPLRWSAAPALGWAIHSAIALPIFMLIGFSFATVIWVTAVPVILSLCFLGRTAVLAKNPTISTDPASPSIPAWACAAAALLALGPALAIFPKIVEGGVVLAGPIFDHAKIAIIDEMARLGLPPGNPVFGGPGATSRLDYYYLWHFSAAELALALGVTGWEADIALTWFTAIASLMLMVALATWLSARVTTAIWVVLFAAAASMRTVLGFFFDETAPDSLIQPATGFAGWLFQAAWAPQHLASASCVVLAFFVLAQMSRRPSVAPTVILAMIVAAGFESSTWVGGVTFVVAAAVTVAVLLIQGAPDQRARFLTHLALAALLAMGLCAPLLYDQYIAAAMRGGAFPIAVEPYQVLADFVPPGLRRVLDLPAYWLLFLVIEFPAVYVTGGVALVRLLASPDTDPEKRTFTLSLAGLTLVSLAVAWLFISTVGENNDLGWRAVLPAVPVLIVFSAAGVSQWIAARHPIPTMLAIVALVLGLPESSRLLYSNAVGHATESKRIFAATPQMWEAVRGHTARNERVANNPLFLADMTPWPANIAWALLSHRRSCFAGREMALVFVPLPTARREEINAQFIRVFDGTGSADDIRDLATRYGCRAIVLTSRDGAWSHDPFAASPYYHLVDERDGQWRIYRGL